MPVYRCSLPRSQLQFILHFKRWNVMGHNRSSSDSKFCGLLFQLPSILIAVIKILTKSRLRRRAFIQLTLPRDHWRGQAESHDGIWRQKVWRNTDYCLLLMASSAYFLIQPRSTCLGVVPPIVKWALTCQSLIKKISPQTFPLLRHL